MSATTAGSDLRVEVETDDDRRSLVAELRIDAPIESVWQALTDAETIANWFAYEAEVTPGEGGRILLQWDEGVAVHCPVQVWEPGRHLRTSWLDPHTAEAPLPEGENSVPEAASRTAVAVDYYLEAEGGSTRLRLVHSGFSKLASWDGFFDGARQGWSYELRSLKHYLERHRDCRRGLARAKRTIDISEEQAWSRLFSADGLGSDGAVDGLRDGEPYSLNPATGSPLSGEVRHVRPHTDFAATVESLWDSLLRIKIGRWSGPQAPVDVRLWLACWRLSGEQLRELEAGWQQMLDSLYPA